MQLQICQSVTTTLRTMHPRAQWPSNLLICSCYKHRSPLWIGVVALAPVLAPVASHHALYLFHGLSAVAAVHPDFPGRPGVVPGAASFSPSVPWPAPAPHSEEHKPANPSASDAAIQHRRFLLQPVDLFAFLPGRRVSAGLSTPPCPSNFSVSLAR